MTHNKRVLAVFVAVVLAFALASAVSIAQTSAYDYILRGERYLASGAADDAIREFNAALSIEPGNTRASFGLGRRTNRDQSAPGFSTIAWSSLRNSKPSENWVFRL